MRHAHVTIIAGLLVACARSAVPAAAPEPPDRECTAHAARNADTPTIWSSTAGDSLSTFRDVGSATVVHRLAGSYRYLSINSEGFTTRTVAEWRLTLEPRDTSGVQDLLFNSDSSRAAYPLIGTMDLVAAYELTGKRRRTRIEGVVVGVAYDSATGTLWLRGEPFEHGKDHGVFDQIYAVNAAGSFHGRWVWPAQEYDHHHTPLGELNEYPAGYFCAWRLD